MASLPRDLLTLSVCATADSYAGGASGLCRGDSGGEAGEDASAHGVLPPLSAAQPGRGGPPPWPLSGRLASAHVWLFIFVPVHG